MTLSSAERNARARLPITRFLMAYVPLPVSRWVLKQSVARVETATSPLARIPNIVRLGDFLQPDPS